MSGTNLLTTAAKHTVTGKVDQENTYASAVGPPSKSMPESPARRDQGSSNTAQTNNAMFAARGDGRVGLL